MKVAPILLLCLVAIGLASAQFQPHCASGRDGKVIVHLFSWRWADIASECENVLGPKGFCGVQVSPPNEHRIVTSPNRPWWERYQPVSWKLDSASGSRADFIDMVQRCNAAGVRIYIDAVINHMAGVDSGTGQGSGGSSYNTQEMQFYGVPFGPTDFGTSCSTSSGNIENYGDANQVRNCRLLGLLDLDGGSSYVRQKLTDYFNDMLDIGIDGYRIDAAKHMWPGDITGVISQTKPSMHGGAPFVYQEVIDLSGSEPIKSSDYIGIGTVTEFKYGLKMAEIFMNNQVDLKHLQTFGSSWGLLPSDKALAFVDNHDNQRGHGGGGNIITHKISRAYKMATAFMLSWPYGVPRVMSSYSFTEDWTGPPSGGPGTSDVCQNGWICEHRWRQITNMVHWRNSAGMAGVDNWWSNGGNQIAYSRGTSSFIAFNRNDGYMNEQLTTGLPAGTYCDVISGNLENGQCTGKSIIVLADSKANIEIDGSDEDPIVAFHIGSKLNGNTATPAPPAGTTGGPPDIDSPPIDRQRTIVFIRKQTTVGQSVFLRGGCSTPCTINMQYVPRSGSHYSSYMSWAVGDSALDWSGAEHGQGSFNGATAQGSPMVWTSNLQTSPGYLSENIYGDHYWMWEVYMDCGQTPDGYFEVKGYLDGQWETDRSQGRCIGQTTGIPLRFSTINNHIARCGYKNVFEWNSNVCIMQRIS